MVLDVSSWLDDRRHLETLRVLGSCIGRNVAANAQADLRTLAIKIDNGVYVLSPTFVCWSLINAVQEEVNVIAIPHDANLASSFAIIQVERQIVSDSHSVEHESCARCHDCVVIQVGGSAGKGQIFWPDSSYSNLNGSIPMLHDVFNHNFKQLTLTKRPIAEYDRVIKFCEGLGSAGRQEVVTQSSISSVDLVESKLGLSAEKRCVGDR